MSKETMVDLLAAALAISLGVVVWLLHKSVRYRRTHKWSDDDLQTARRESINRNRSVVAGKVEEHLAPLAPAFFERFNPKDARFLGGPIDFVVFDGLDEGDLRCVCFVEVKTGSAALTQRERRVRDAIQRRDVSFELMRFDSVPGPALTPFEDTPKPRIEPPETTAALQP
jgi:predicted Holliday junction resolvase-like endonuclease